MMKRTKTIGLIGIWCLLGAPMVGCNDVVAQNLAIGLREGSLTAASGIITEAFNHAFGLEEAATEEGGNDEHVHE